MIHVERIDAPPGFDEWSTRELLKAYEFFVGTPESERGQQRFPFEVYRRSEAKQTLNQIFHGKCAYCESKFGAAQPVDVEHFRPKASVAESPEHPGYWWLAGEWGNLLPICIDCSMGKKNRFPIAEESKRAFTPEADLSLEAPLLLNPYYDFPEQHLVFNEDGTVAGTTVRGNTTIQVLALNRMRLVEARRSSALYIKARIIRVERLAKTIGRDGLSENLEEDLKEELEEVNRLIADDQEFAGMKRQLAYSYYEELGIIETAPLVVPDKVIKVSEAEKQLAQETSAAFQSEQESYSLREHEGRQKFRGQRRMIEWVKIHNVKAIQDLELDLTTSHSDKTPWLMLLGENATGKSTVLQAIALTFVGPEYFAELVKQRSLQSQKYIRNNEKLTTGSVQVKLSGFRNPHILTFHDSGVEFKSPLDEVTTVNIEGDEVQVTGKGWEPQALLLGYGATRLLPRRAFDAYGGEYARVDNLFDPFLPLIDAEKWLLGLDETAFNRAALVLKDLLVLDKDTLLDREEGGVKLVASASKVALMDLSDGYQSAIALTIDILQAFSEIWPKMEDAEGIVLLDEIGAHLHPRWQMRIVASLRKALPGVQFVATTHDPLCLRGLAEGEIVVMRREPNGRIVQLSNLPDPGEFRVDQLLTHRFFGLLDTFDPELEKLYDEYYHLKVLGEEHLEPEQKARLQVLRGDLKNRKLLGATRREELIYEAIDDSLAREHTGEGPPDIDTLNAETVARIRGIWEENIEY